MNDSVSITVEASNQSDVELISNQISTCLTGVGFTDVSVFQTFTPQYKEPTSQEAAVQAIHRLNPQLFSTPISISGCVGSFTSVQMPDGPDED